MKETIEGMFGLEGKVAIVTGGNGGIGRLGLIPRSDDNVCACSGKSQSI